jgi:hypothetical protein
MEPAPRCSPGRFGWRGVAPVPGLWQQAGGSPQDYPGPPWAAQVRHTYNQPGAGRTRTLETVTAPGEIR